MLCPNCKKETLKERVFYGLHIDKCSECGGIWFDKGEFQKAKEEKDEYLNWLEVDLWKDSDKFLVSSSDNKICPFCRQNLYRVTYGESEIEVDICNLCQGLWLDKGEFKKIIDYLNQTIGVESLNDHLKHTFVQFGEILTGSKSLSSEIKDYLVVRELFKYKFCGQYPNICNIINQLPM